METKIKNDFYNDDYIRLGTNQVHKTAIVYDNVKMGTNNIIGPYCVIGSNGEIRGADQNMFQGEVHIGNNNVISEHVTIQRPFMHHAVTLIGSGNIIMAHAHVGHDASIGDNCEICTSTVIGGYAKVRNGAKLKICCAVRNRVIIGENATIGMGSVVVKDIPDNSVAYGNPAKISQ